MAVALPHIMLVVGKKVGVGTEVGRVVLIFPFAQQSVLVYAQPLIKFVEFAFE